MKMYAAALLGMLLTATAMTPSWAQDSKTTKTLGPDVFRLGKSVLFTVHAPSHSAPSVYTVSYHLAACDGSWVVQAFAVQFLTEAAGNHKALQAMALDALTKPREMAIEFEDWPKNDDSFLGPYRTQVLRKCSAAKPVPRGVLLQLAKSKSDYHFVLASTAVRKGNVIDAWTVDYPFTSKPVTLEGIPLKSSGEVITAPEFAEQRTVMARDLYECASNSSTAVSYLRYGRDGRVEKSIELAKEQQRSKPNVPLSVAEVITEGICKIF